MSNDKDSNPEGNAILIFSTLLVMAIVVFKIFFPGPTASLPITSWHETLTTQGIFLGFFYICIMSSFLGASIGYFGLPWLFAYAPPGLRMLHIFIMLPVPLIVLAMQKKYYFIASPVHIGITSACLIIGIFIGTAIESVKYSNYKQGPTRFESTFLKFSLTVICCIWGGVAGKPADSLKVEFPIPHNLTLSISLIGVLIGWILSFILGKWIKMRYVEGQMVRKFNRRVLVLIIGIVSVIHLVVLPSNMLLGLMHDISLTLFGTPSVVIAFLTGIHAGVVAIPDTSAK